jgi:hypothetical protein
MTTNKRTAFIFIIFFDLTMPRCELFWPAARSGGPCYWRLWRHDWGAMQQTFHFIFHLFVSPSEQKT